MSSDSRLAALEQKLRSMGMVVVGNSRGFDVRLATLEKIRVSLKDGALELEPYFALVPRVRATFSATALYAVVVPWFFLNKGLTPASFSLAFLCLLSALYMAIRYTTTESCMTRIQFAWLTLEKGLGSGVVPDSASLPEGQSSGASWYSDQRPAHSEIRREQR